MTPRLPRAAESLARARRLIDDLKSEQHTGESRFRDRLPAVLDLLDGVSRGIDEQSAGQRTPVFSAWWKTQWTAERREIRELRNAELKRLETKTRAHFTVVINESLNTGPSGTTGATTSTLAGAFFFDGGHFDGEEVVPTLQAYASHLEAALTEAERLLAVPD